MPECACDDAKSRQSIEHLSAWARALEDDFTMRVVSCRHRGCGLDAQPVVVFAEKCKPPWGQAQNHCSSPIGRHGVATRRHANCPEAPLVEGAGRPSIEANLTSADTSRMAVLTRNGDAHLSLTIK
jgi:hypothetical protein